MVRTLELDARWVVVTFARNITIVVTRLANGANVEHPLVECFSKTSLIMYGRCQGTDEMLY
jgi:hypothetical protein